MTKDAVLAVFTDVKTIKTRSCLQLVLEIPLEQADDALHALGGFPLPGESTWVGIALAPADRAEIKKAEKRKFEELPLSQQAALRCEDNDFCQFLAHRINGPLGTLTPADIVRVECEVDSRSKFDSDPQAAARWKRLDAQFRQWQTDQRYAASIHK